MQHIDRFSRYAQYLRVTNTDKQTDVQTTLHVTSVAIGGMDEYGLQTDLKTDTDR